MFLQNILFYDFHALGHSREETPPGSNRWHTYQQNSSFTNARPSFHIPCIICTGMYCPKGYRFWADGYRICPLWLEIKYSFQEDPERVLGNVRNVFVLSRTINGDVPAEKRGESYVFISNIVRIWTTGCQTPLTREFLGVTPSPGFIVYGLVYRAHPYHFLFSQTSYLLLNMCNSAYSNAHNRRPLVPSLLISPNSLLRLIS